MPNFPVGQPRASRCGSQNAYVRFACEPTKLEPLRIRECLAKNHSKDRERRGEAPPETEERKLQPALA